jgi:hypothetical protein
MRQDPDSCLLDAKKQITRFRRREGSLGAKKARGKVGISEPRVPE